MAKKVIESVQEERDAKLYEFAFHLVPKMTEEEALASFTDIKKQITASGATIKNESAPALLNLEYKMELTVESVKSKYNQAYFAWVILEATGPQLDILKEDIRLRTDIIRHLLITTKNESPIQSADVARALSTDEDESDLEVLASSDEESVEAPIKEDDTEDKKVDDAIDKLAE